MSEEVLSDKFSGVRKQAIEAILGLDKRDPVKDPDRAALILTYLSSEEINKHSENLVKETKTLNCWTKVIGVTAIVMVLTTIAQIFLTSLFSARF